MNLSASACSRRAMDRDVAGSLSALNSSALSSAPMSFAIVGVFGGFAYRAVKREQRRIAEENAKREADESSPPFDESR